MKPALTVAVCTRDDPHCLSPLPGGACLAGLGWRRGRGDQRRRSASGRRAGSLRRPVRTPDRPPRPAFRCVPPCRGAQPGAAAGPSRPRSVPRPGLCRRGGRARRACGLRRLGARGFRNGGPPGTRRLARWRCAPTWPSSTSTTHRGASGRYSAAIAPCWRGPKATVTWFAGIRRSTPSDNRVVPAAPRPAARET